MKRIATMCIALISVSIIVTGCFKKPVTNDDLVGTTNKKSPACEQGVTAVCGVDGVTYRNPCVAKESGASVSHDGPCSTTTNLTDNERLYLFWLLQKRTEFAVPTVSIRHKKTVPLECDDCALYYYEWDNGASEARVEVMQGTVMSAVDTTGRDYMTGLQGEPTSFFDHE